MIFSKVYLKIFMQKGIKNKISIDPSFYNKIFIINEFCLQLNLLIT